MPKSFFTGTVVAPPFFTAASTLHEIVTSRSVAVSSRRSPSALMSTLERMGRVVREPTTFCTALRPVMSLSFAMVKFIFVLPLIVFFSYLKQSYY